MKYQDQYDVIHSDEKWFFLHDLRKKRLNFPGEPKFKSDTCPSKRHRSQVMVTALINRPSGNNPNYDGCVMLQPHGDILPCRNASANRPSGTLEFINHKIDHAYFYEQQVKNDGILNGIINKINPETHMFIQLDNAPPHVGSCNYINL